MNKADLQWPGWIVHLAAHEGHQGADGDLVEHRPLLCWRPGDLDLIALPAHLGQIGAVEQALISQIDAHGLAQVVGRRHQIAQHAQVTWLHTGPDLQAQSQLARPQGRRLSQGITPPWQGHRIIERKAGQLGSQPGCGQAFAVQPIGQQPSPGAGHPHQAIHIRYSTACCGSWRHCHQLSKRWRELTIDKRQACLQ
jgi:hypothetical protein